MSKMIFQSPVQLFTKRLSATAFVASSCLALLFLLFQARSSPRTTKFLGGIRGSSDSLDDVFNSTLGFEKIFVLGLASRTDRRDGMVLSAALTGLEIEYVDGVLGKDVLDKSIPSKPGNIRMDDGAIGCWRGHLNIIQEIIRRNISSALILEDDADWDVRIKQQFRDLALSTRALTQPLLGTESNPLYADPTFPIPSSPSALPLSDILFENLPATVTPKNSPYGNNWDFLWVGQCGMRFPILPNKDIPKGRVVQHDVTVPQQQYLVTLSSPDDVKEQYPNHTRVVHHVQDGVCSVGYAITQATARHLLHEIGLNDINVPFDILLREFCEGTQGRKYHNCLTMQPSLFHHHRPAGMLNSESDISDHGHGYREKPETLNVRWSTRINWDVLLDGRTDFVDSYPDAE